MPTRNPKGWVFCPMDQASSTGTVTGSASTRCKWLVRQWDGRDRGPGVDAAMVGPSSTRTSNTSRRDECILLFCVCHRNLENTLVIPRSTRGLIRGPQGPAAFILESCQPPSVLYAVRYGHFGGSLGAHGDQPRSTINVPSGPPSCWCDHGTCGCASSPSLCPTMSSVT